MRFGSRAKRLKIKRLLLAAVIILVVGLLIIIFKSLDKPAQGVINNQVLPSSESKPVQVTPVAATGKYVSFKYPSSFSVTPSTKAEGNELETFAYVKQPSPFWFLNITVSSLPSGNLSDDGSYNMRSLDAARYKKGQLQINGTLVTTFYDGSDGYAKTAFIAHGGKLFSLSLHSNDTPNADKLDNVFADVLKSLKWLN
jgi:hypothetical protein